MSKIVPVNKTQAKCVFTEYQKLLPKADQAVCDLNHNFANFSLYFIQTKFSYVYFTAFM